MQVYKTNKTLFFLFTNLLCWQYCYNSERRHLPHGFKECCTLLVLRFSQSHITSDHLLIKALAHRSFPLSEGSQNALRTQKKHRALVQIRMRSAAFVDRSAPETGVGKKAKRVET